MRGLKLSPNMAAAGPPSSARRENKNSILATGAARFLAVAISSERGFGHPVRRCRRPFQLAHGGVLRGVRDCRNPRSAGDQGNRRTSGSQLLTPEKWHSIFSAEKISLVAARHARQSASELVWKQPNTLLKCLLPNSESFNTLFSRASFTHANESDPERSRGTVQIRIRARPLCAPHHRHAAGLS